ncbi:fructose-specific PTS transporter subunit EIIC [Clostridium thailandense]|uniref:PTS fructose transporter subunit IIABC n=1 Tax=Clostridium thailandense TaxID=2794346 RepID=UPI00398A0A56
MKITELLTKNTIIVELNSTTKADVIDELTNKLDSAGKLNDKNEFKNAIWERENEFSTGIGEGIAIPHAKTAAVKTPSLAFGRSADGIDYDSLDGNKSHIFFMIAASEGAHNEHLDTLSRLSSMLMNESFKQKLMNAKTENEILKIVDEEENIYLKGKETNAGTNSKESKSLILAITACPTGIAHTYMAAEALQIAAKEMGIDIKVETQGSVGAENVITGQDLKEAKAVIIAADTKVDKSRFEGMPMVVVSVKDAIKDAKGLINEALQAKPTGIKETTTPRVEKKERAGLYKHLMTGVSHMIPFVVAGGLLIAIGFALGGIYVFNCPGTVAEAIFSTGKQAFALMLPVLAGYMAYSIADRPGLVPGFVGGALASNIGAGFLGALIAGLLAGYVVTLIKKYIKLPKTLDGLMPVLIIPVLSTIIIGLIMMFILGTPMKAINDGLTAWLKGLGGANAAVLGIVLGCFMAFDMGGPFNKAAYIFATGTLASGGSAIMAAVMAAGMTPPLGIALATVIAKKKFTEQEREAGKAAWALGVSFITEGAIPFAAGDPLRVIPSVMAGSAVTGALSMIFGCTLAVPHGGIWILVIPNVVTHLLQYVIAIAAGTVVTALILSAIKKDVVE